MIGIKHVCRAHGYNGHKTVRTVTNQVLGGGGGGGGELTRRGFEPVTADTAVPGSIDLDSQVVVAC